MTTGHGLTIVVEPSDYVLRNAGDMAMMQVAVTRLSNRWPDAEIAVFSDAPDRLPPYAPNAHAVDAAGRRVWLRTPLVPDRLVPRRLRPRVARTSRWLRIRAPRLAFAAIAWRLSPDARRRVTDHVALMGRAHLVLAAGMGGITDAFPHYAAELLETLAGAQHAGAVTAMVSQGIGPIADQRLRADAATVLRRVDLIALREERAGRPLLRQLGVDSDRVVTTGDDAIELAVGRARHDVELGGAIGVNVRISDYSALTDTAAAGVSGAVHAAARRLGARLRAIAISTVPGEDDALAIGRLFGVVDGASDVPVPGLDDVIAAIAECRVVVTGSYHAAVFALSMGVPAIGLAASPYYEDKFLGLAQQFGVGCDVVLLAGRVGDTDELAGIIERAWDRAPCVRSTLCAAAAEQVVLSHEAYERVAALVDGGRRPDGARPGAVVAVRYGSWRLGAATFYRRLRSRSDVSRWSSLDSFETTWDPRAELIAGLVPAGSRVIEFGAGRRQLEALLPDGCTYIPSDLVDRGPGTLVVDLDDRPLPDLGRLEPDVAVFAGVFEYLHHFADVPRWLAAQVPRCIASYECASSAAGTLARVREHCARLRNGWVTAYTEPELVDLFTAAGWDCTDRRTWTTPDGDERIFVFERP